MKKVRFSALLAALALFGLVGLLLGGCGSKVNISEEEVVARAKQELALLSRFMRISAASIKADLNNCGVIYEDVTITLPEEPSLRLHLDKIVMRGMDIPSYEGNPGEMTDIETLSYHDLKVFMHDTQVAGLDSYEISKLRLPYRDIVQTLRVGQNLPLDKFAISLLPYFTNYESGRTLAKNFTISHSMVQVGIDKMEALDSKPGLYGPSYISGVKASLMGRRVFSLERLSCEGVTLPQIFMDLMADPEGYASSHPDFEERMEADPLGVLSPFEIRGVSLDDLYINAGDAPITLKKFTGDFRISENGMTLKSGMQNLTLSRALLAQHRDFRKLGSALKEDLVLSGDFNMGLEAPLESPKADAFVQFSLKDRTLGGTDFDIAMTGPREMMTDPALRDTPPLLKSVSASLENNGLIDLFVRCMAATSYPPASYEETYAEMLGVLKKRQATLETDLQRDLLAKLITLVEEGGKLTASLTPPTPLFMDSLKGINEEELLNLGFTLDYTPPATPKQK